MDFSLSSVLNRVRVLDLWQHIPIQNGVTYPTGGPVRVKWKMGFMCLLLVQYIDTETLILSVRLTFITKISLKTERVNREF